MLGEGRLVGREGGAAWGGGAGAERGVARRALLGSVYQALQHKQQNVNKRCDQTQKSVCIDRYVRKQGVASDGVICSKTRGHFRLSDMFEIKGMVPLKLVPE